MPRKSRTLQTADVSDPSAETHEGRSAFRSAPLPNSHNRSTQRVMLLPILPALAETSGRSQAHHIGHRIRRSLFLANSPGECAPGKVKESRVLGLDPGTPHSGPAPHTSAVTTQQRISGAVFPQCEDIAQMRQFRATACLAIVGMVLSGGFMVGGSLLLGHARPTWMEFENTGIYAVAGFVIGAGIGLVIDYLRPPRPQ